MTVTRRAADLLRMSAVTALLASGIVGAVGVTSAGPAAAAPKTATVVDAGVVDRIDAESPTLTTGSSTGTTVTTGAGAGAAASAVPDTTIPIQDQQGPLSAVAEAPDRARASATGIAPFTLIGIAAHTPGGADALVRVHKDGAWTAWAPLTFATDDAPDPGSAEAAGAAAANNGVPTSEGVWFGASDGYELSLPAGSTDLKVMLAREQAPDASTPMDVASEPAANIDSRPDINPRSSWGARPPKEPYDYAPDVEHAIVHHSVTQNAYSPADVPSILRSIQAFHMDGQGWNDIAYNFAVDKYGTIWEARGGGVTSTVIGGHTYGANTATTGVVALGDFSAAAPTQAMVNSIGDLLGWKLAIHGVDPQGSSDYQIRASERYAEGQMVNFASIIGHRDVNFTGCPGDNLYPRLGEIRQRAAIKWAQMTFQVFESNNVRGGFADIVAPYQLSSGIRLFCDWNGDGIDTPGSFRGGTWFITDDPSGGPATRVFGFGDPGDTPVCGDWNGDGIDSPGVVRNGAWYLTDTVGSPFANIVIGYGNPGDIPIVGDWNGDGKDTPGVVRNAVWYLVNTPGQGIADKVLAYGNPGDTPVVGDWNHDGIDSPGIVRNGVWYLTDTVATGIAQWTFAYGDPGDVAVAGDWNGDGFDSPGVIRFP
jgi:hypothetical protein